MEDGGWKTRANANISSTCEFTWVFPKIMVPPNHPFYIIGFSIINLPFWGTPIFGNTHMTCCFVLHLSQMNSGMVA